MKKILVVDDEPQILKIMKEIFEREGMNVDTAEDGIECGNKLFDNHYDVVLMDLQMPNLDGMRTIKYLRHGNNPLHRSLKIIVVSAHIDDELTKELGKYNIRSFRKPCDLEELVAEVAKND